MSRFDEKLLSLQTKSWRHTVVRQSKAKYLYIKHRDNYAYFRTIRLTNQLKMSIFIPINFLTDIIMEKKENPEFSATSETKELLLDLLRSLNCKQVDSPDDSIRAYYRGEGLIFFVHERNVRIFDPVWAHISNNSPELTLIWEAVNFTNTRSRPTVFLSYPDENDVIQTHCRYDLLLYPSCSDNEEILRELIDSFFDAKGCLRQSSYDLFTTENNRKKQQENR